MRVFSRYIFTGLLLLVLSGSRAQSDSLVRKLLENVRDASYYDSLKVFSAGKKVLEAGKDYNQHAILSELNIYYGNHFFYTINYLRAQYYYELALKEAQLAKSSHLSVLARLRLTYIESETEPLEQIEKKIRLLEKEAKANNDFENQAEILNMYGVLNNDAGKSDAAARYYVEGLNLAKTKNLPYYEATFHNNLGLIKYVLDEIDNALLDFSEVIKISKKINNKRLQSHAKLNMCLILLAKENYKEAHELFAEVIEYASANHHPLELASAYSNLGAAYVQNKNPKLGLQYADSSIHVLEKYGLKNEMVEAYLGKSQIEIELNKFKDAEKTLDIPHQLIVKSKNKEQESQYYLAVYELYNRQKNYKKALENYLLYTTTAKELESKLNSKALEELQLKYSVQAKEIELEKEKTKSLMLEKSNQEERFIKWITIGASLILLILVSMLLYNRYIRSIREQQAAFSRELIKNSEAERSRLAKDLHDDIGQSLSILKSKFTNKNQFENTEIISKEIERVIDQTREISRNLYPSYLEKIGLERAIAGLTESVQTNYQIECSYDITGADRIPMATATHIYRILQECVNNTIKHSKATALKISIEHNKNEYVLNYLDNGNWKKGNIKESGIGLLSIKERAKIIGGNLSIDENDIKGFKLTLKFDLS